LYLRAVVDFEESRLFKQRELRAVTAAPDAMQTEIADTIDNHVWTREVSAAAQAAEAKRRSEYVLDESTCERVRDTAVQLCMLACGDSACLTLFRCPSKAVQLYDDAEVRGSIIRAFGEVSRGQFEALCTKAYAYRKHILTEMMLPQDVLEKIGGKEHVGLSICSGRIHAQLSLCPGSTGLYQMLSCCLRRVGGLHCLTDLLIT
jgi:hypothetical protein